MASTSRGYVLTGVTVHGVFRAWADCMIMAFTTSIVEVLAFIRCIVGVMLDVSIVVALVPLLLVSELLAALLKSMVGGKP